MGKSGFWVALGCLAVLAASARGAPPDQATYTIRPSEADPAVRNFDDPNIVLIDRNAGNGAQLAIFLPGTNGRPQNVLPLLGVIALQGYRVIGLEYDDEPAVVQVCPGNRDPNCSANFRQERIFGEAQGAPLSNPPEESIVHRLVALLTYLDKQHPGEHWGDYVVGGEPDWSRIVVSGLSQGAGMAAFIAKRKAVARAVLFSSPWDFQGRIEAQNLAPWIAEPSVTPPARWFAELHRRENTAALIAKSYDQLQIPVENVRIFNRDLPAGKDRGQNPFHGSTVHDPGYMPDWQFLYGKSP